MNAGSFLVGGKPTQSTNANIFSPCFAHFGEKLNIISTANDSTFTVSGNDIFSDGV